VIKEVLINSPGQEILIGIFYEIKEACAFDLLIHA